MGIVVSAQHLACFSGTTDDFSIREHFWNASGRIPFGSHGENFEKWFGGMIISPQPPRHLYALVMWDGGKEIDALGTKGLERYDVSLVIIYHLLQWQETERTHFFASDGMPNIFISVDGKSYPRLLALFKKGSRWHIHGYSEAVREKRFWYPHGHLIMPDYFSRA